MVGSLAWGKRGISALHLFQSHILVIPMSQASFLENSKKNEGYVEFSLQTSDVAHLES